MLPEGFEWRHVLRQESGIHGVYLGQREVARLSQRADGQWQALLRPHAELFSPYVMRDCTSFDTGRAGIEAWVCRHEARLRSRAGIDPRTTNDN